MEKRKGNRKSRLQKAYRTFLKNRTLCLMALPAASLLFVLNYLPMTGIILAFKSYRVDLGIFRSAWNGLKNFKFFFTSQDAWIILRNTIVINFASILLGLVVAVAISLMINEIKSRRRVKIYQSILFFPYFLSWVVVSYMLYSFLSPPYGMLNQLIIALGGDKVQWYSEPSYWPVILVLAGIWKGMGYGSITYYARIMGIDNEYYEAARIDGANRLQMATKITLPLLKPVIVINILLQAGRILNSDFGLFYFLPKGSARLFTTTSVIDTYVYGALTSTGNIGIGAATGLFQSFTGLILMLLVNWIARKISPENALF